MIMPIRWVSVVEFHDRALCIDKVFGQELTEVKWNYQILGLHPVTVCQKLGVILLIKWLKNWSQQKMLFTKKVFKLIFFNDIFFYKDSDDFWHRKFTLKVQNWHFLMNCHQMETQNLVISFDYSWFLAKNLAYAECWIMKFHYRNSSSGQRVLAHSSTHSRVSLFWHILTLEFTRVQLVLIKHYSSESSIKFLTLESLKTCLCITRVF
jgi:hypothetical protein